MFDAAMQILLAFPELSEDNFLLFLGNKPSALRALVFLDFLEPLCNKYETTLLDTYV